MPSYGLFSDLLSPEHQQTRSPHACKAVTNGSLSVVGFQSMPLTRPTQGWLWSRVPLTASNFVLEVEFKVRMTRLECPEMVLIAYARSLETTTTFMEMASQYGLRRSVQNRVRYLAALVGPGPSVIALQPCSHGTPHRQIRRSWCISRYVRLLPILHAPAVR